MHGQSDYSHLAGSGLFLFVIVFLFAYLIISFYNPRWAQRKVRGHATGENDSAVTFIWALVISFVVLFLLGLLMYAFTAHC